MKLVMLEAVATGTQFGIDPDGATRNHLLVMSEAVAADTQSGIEP